MKTILRVFCLLMAIAASVQAFWNDESKYMKKFAMMKVYESCFGDDVVREIREEMRIAAARCAQAESMGHVPAATPSVVPGPTTAAPTPQHVPVQTNPLVRPNRPQQDRHRPSTVLTSSANNAMSAESLLRLQVLLQGLRANSGANVAATFPHQQQQIPTPQNIPPQQHYNPGAFPGPYPVPHNYHHGMVQQPFGPSPYYYPNSAPMMNPYYNTPFNPYAPFMQRSSRDVRGGIGRARNVTCVMQELGYLDANMEPNFAGIINRIERLALPVELRKDMVDAVNFCQKFSQCLPEPDEDKMQVSSEFSKPMVFFKCYKQKKLEACVLKDVRERFMSHAAAAGNSADDPEIPDTNNLEDEDSETPTNALRFRSRSRSGRIMKSPARSSSEIAELLLDDVFTI